MRVIPRSVKPMTHTDLISLIERAAAAKGIAPATFTTQAVNDGKFYSRLQRGGTVTLKTVERIRVAAAEAGVSS